MTASYLDTALARLRSGWRVKWLPMMVDGKIDYHGRGAYIVYGPHGDQGVSENPVHALNYYMWRCAHGPQEPLVPTWRDMLPCEQETEDMMDGHGRMVHWSEM